MTWLSCTSRVARFWSVVMEATKRCVRCEVTKALEAFSRWSYSRDGRASRCRECMKAHRADPTYRERENAQWRERLADPERRIRRLATDARLRAKARGLPFDEDLSDLLPPPIHCPVLDIPLSYATGQGQRWNAPSIDRIDPAQGYLKGNRIVVSVLANQIKSTATPDQIRKVADFYERLTERRDAR